MIRNRFKLGQLLVAAALVVGISACGLEQLGQQLQDAIKQEAFNQIKKEAENNGGTAEWIRAGESYLVEISDETSPIYGASVSLAADALPIGVSEAVLSIAHLDGFQNPDTTKTPAGPAADILLRSLPELEPVELSVAAQVYMPYTTAAVTTTTDEDKLYVGHLPVKEGDATANKSWTLLAGQSVDTTDRRVAGNTKTFSPFMAIIDKPAPIPEKCPDPTTAPGSGSVTATVDGGTQLNLDVDFVDTDTCEEVGWVQVDSASVGTTEYVSIGAATAAEMIVVEFDHSAGTTEAAYVEYDDGSTVWYAETPTDTVDVNLTDWTTGYAGSFTAQAFDGFGNAVTITGGFDVSE